MLRTVIGLIVCVSMVFVNGIVKAETVDPATVVAKVNNADIVQGDVDFAFNVFVLPQVQARNQGKPLTDEQRQQVNRDIIDRLVTQKVLLQAAADAKVTPDEAQVKQQMDAIKTQRQDIAEDKLKQLVQDELAIQKMIEQNVVAKVTVTDEEVQKIYDEHKDQFNEPEQVQASHILAQVKSDAPQAEKDAARKKIETALADVKAGKDFAELAKQYSDCPSKDRGGDLGFFGRGMMVKPFEDAAFAMKEGQLSDIVETQFGYHIIKVTARKDARQVPFEEAKEGIKNQTLQQKKNAEVTNWIKGLRDKAKIEIIGQAKPEETKADAPKTEEPKADAPKTEEPKTDAPKPAAQ